jgi:hypothetical protein
MLAFRVAAEAVPVTAMATADAIRQARNAPREPGFFMYVPSWSEELKLRLSRTAVKRAIGRADVGSAGD